MTVDSTYMEVARLKQAERELLIKEEWRLKDFIVKGTNVLDVPASCGILTEREIGITSENDALDIVQKIRKGEYSVEEVTVAFCKRAAISQQLTNCLTEIFFEEAIERAREMDRQRAADPEKLPPLFGLPISLKDSFNIPGKDSTIGLVCFAHRPATEYSALPALLVSLGAVLYCKTNVPQTMMTADSDNNVFGRTLNPSNLGLTAGGSTGGEGALIALRGSVAGFGTDIAGSIRIPSACNGVYGFRPSADIVPYGGQQSPAPEGIAGIAPVAGPMATSLRSVSFLLQSVIEAQPWRFDASCIHLPWLSKVHPDKQRLRIALVSDDGLCTPTPPVRRNLSESGRKLREAGVEVIDLKLPDVAEAIGTALQMFGLDGSQFVQALIKSGKEPFVNSVKKVNLAAIPAASMETYFQLNATRHRIQEAYRKLWLENKLDALIIPPAPHTAVPFDTWGPITYTTLWNLLDYPAVVVPTGRVQPTDTADDISNAKYGKQDAVMYQLYTGPEEYKDAPLTLQLVGMRQEDEKLAQVAAIVDGMLNK